MALIFMDGFDHYAVGDLTLKWTTVTAASPLIAPEWGVRPGSQGLIIGGNSNTLISKTLPTGYGTFTCGFYFRTGSIANASTIVAFTEGGTEHVSVRYDTSGHIIFSRNGTTLATSTNTISTGVWYHIEVKVTISDTVGVYEVRVDGTSTNWIPSASSADTRNGGTSVVNDVRIFNRGANDSSATAHRFDDFYFLDSSGSVANTFLGPVRVATLRPDRAGNYTQWVGNYADNFANVQDFQADGDSTFNQTATNGKIDTFDMDQLPSATVYGVQHVIQARQDSGSGKTIRPKSRISSTDYNGTSQATGATHAFLREAVTISPATSAQWTAAEINGAEFGYEKVS